MTPRLMKALLLAAGLVLPVTATGAAAAQPVGDGYRGHEAAEARHHGKAARRHARRHARHEVREHAREHARAHARAAYAARYRHAYRHEGYGNPRHAYRPAYPWVRYWGAYGFGYPRRDYRGRYHDADCDRY